jgi:hypothetical protein
MGSKTVHVFGGQKVRIVSSKNGVGICHQNGGVKNGGRSEFKSGVKKSKGISKRFQEGLENREEGRINGQEGSKGYLKRFQEVLENRKKRGRVREKRHRRTI